MFFFEFLNSMLTLNFKEVYLFFLRSTNTVEFHYYYYIFFTLLICFFATTLILVNNPIYSVISLILVYLCASFLLILLEVSFLAVIFILVYLGAVVVLFLFIVMMLNVKVMGSLNFITFIPFLFIVSILFLFFFPSVLFFFKSDLEFIQTIPLNDILFIDFFSFFNLSNLFFDTYMLEKVNYNLENYNGLAFLLYTHFFLDLIVASFVLLLAMVGCISLTLFREKQELKKQNTMSQILHSNSILLRKKN